MGFDFDKLNVNYKEENRAEKLKELQKELRNKDEVKKLLNQKICIGPEDLTKEMAYCAFALVADEYKGDEKIQKALSDFTALFVTGMFTNKDISKSYLIKKEKDNGK